MTRRGYRVLVVGFEWSVLQRGVLAAIGDDSSPSGGLTAGGPRPISFTGSRRAAQPVAPANHEEAAMWFTIGDHLAGAVVGVVTALIVRLIVAPGMDMVVAMLLGMGAGMLLHLLIGFLLAPALGMFQTMLPGSLIGMYGGMLFAMRDSMGAGSRTLGEAAAVGALFGIVVVAGLKIYDRSLRGV